MLRRETYATNSMTKDLERQKQEQDFLIDHLYQRLHEQQLVAEQYSAQAQHHQEVPLLASALAVPTITKLPGAAYTAGRPAPQHQGLAGRAEAAPVAQDGKDARQALTGATKDMAAVHAEKAALLAQWQSALQAITKRDAALKARHPAPPAARLPPAAGLRPCIAPRAAARVHDRACVRLSWGLRA